MCLGMALHRIGFGFVLKCHPTLIVVLAKDGDNLAEVGEFVLSFVAVHIYLDLHVACVGCDLFESA